MYLGLKGRERRGGGKKEVLREEVGRVGCGATSRRSGNESGTMKICRSSSIFSHKFWMELGRGTHYKQLGGVRHAHGTRGRDEDRVDTINEVKHIRNSRCSYLEMISFSSRQAMVRVRERLGERHKTSGRGGTEPADRRASGLRARPGEDPAAQREAPRTGTWRKKMM